MNAPEGSDTMSRQEPMRPLQETARKSAAIDPAIKSWIDHVIAPAIIERLLAQEDSKAA